MPRFTAETPEISAAGARLAGLADQLAAARSAMARLEPAGHAADHPAVAGAIAAFAGAWTGTVEEMATGASGLATNTGAAAENYEHTDASQFRAGR
jgi:Excreted virulence factor EspC, type VII ESX diderm